MILLTLMIEQMDKTLIEKLKEVIQQHQYSTGEKVVNFYCDWASTFDGNSQIVKVNVNIEK